MNLNPVPATVFHTATPPDPLILVHCYGSFPITDDTILHPNHSRSEILSGVRVNVDEYRWEDTRLEELHVVQVILQNPRILHTLWHATMGQYWVEVMERHDRHHQDDQIYRRRRMHIFEAAYAGHQLDVTMSFSQNSVATQVSAIKRALTYCYANLWFYPISVVFQMIKDSLSYH